FLPRPVALARERGVPVLHHVWQHRTRDWPGQEASDGPELDPYHPCAEAADDLGARVRRIVGIHRDVAPDHIGMLLPEREEGGIAGLHVTGRWEIDRRCPAPAPEDRGDVDRHPDLAPRREPAGVPLTPIGPGRAGVIKV